MFEHLGYDHELPVADACLPHAQTRRAPTCLRARSRIALPAFPASFARWGRALERDAHDVRRTHERTRRAHSGLTLKFMLALLSEPGFRDIKRVQEFGLFD